MGLVPTTRQIEQFATTDDAEKSSILKLVVVGTETEATTGQRTTADFLASFGKLRSCGARRVSRNLRRNALSLHH